MSKVIFDVGVSLDGFIAGPNRGSRNPLGDGGPAIHAWAIRHMRSKISPMTRLSSPVSPSSPRPRLSANVMGKRVFEEGEANWPENAPFHTPVFVLTYERRSPWERPSGTTFHFVNDGMESALERARAAVERPE